MTLKFPLNEEFKLDIRCKKECTVGQVIQTTIPSYLIRRYTMVIFSREDHNCLVRIVSEGFTIGGNVDPIQHNGVVVNMKTVEIVDEDDRDIEQIIANLALQFDPVTHDPSEQTRHKIRTILQTIIERESINDLSLSETN